MTDIVLYIMQTSVTFTLLTEKFYRKNICVFLKVCMLLLKLKKFSRETIFTHFMCVHFIIFQTASSLRAFVSLVCSSVEASLMFIEPYVSGTGLRASHRGVHVILLTTLFFFFLT